MAGLKEIQNRIRSIQDTKKITNAMYLISSTKLKKARRDLEATEPYFYTLQGALERILRHLPDMEHEFLENPNRGKKTVALLVITADRGMAGGYNHNVLRMAEKRIQEEKQKGRRCRLFVVGQVGRQYFAARRIPIEECFRYSAQNPTFNRARWITETLLVEFQAGGIDELCVFYTRMINGMRSEEAVKQILPVCRFEMKEPDDVMHENFEILPDAQEALSAIIPNYTAGFLYGALVESFCSEQNARMEAMQAATDNANELLRDLGVLYNRARQAAITQEITEVSSGARAQKRSREEERRL